MRVVLDTNVIISAFLWDGPPTDILVALQTGIFEAFSSSDVLTEELDRILRKPKFRHRLSETGYTADSIVRIFGSLADIVCLVDFLEPPPVRDPDDIAVLSTAYSARADFIITGDDDLLSLKKFSSIRIITPRRMIDILQSRQLA